MGNNSKAETMVGKTKVIKTKYHLDAKGYRCDLKGCISHCDVCYRGWKYKRGER